MSPPRPLPFSAAPPPPESELEGVKKKIAEKETEIAEEKRKVEAAAEDVRVKEAALPTPMPEKLTEQQKELLDSLKSARAKEHFFHSELAALRGLLLELQKKENLLLASSAFPGANLKPADEAVQRFWRELPNATLDGEGAVLRLPDGADWVGSSDASGVAEPMAGVMYARPGVYEVRARFALHLLKNARLII